MSASALTLGVFEGSGQEYLFDGNESLVTIARPGRGKSQAHVVRNLLRLAAPAIVLDVKPELYDLTSRWRSQQVGPVQVFKPGDLDVTASFNPLDAVPSDPLEAYAAISRLLPLLMVPTDAKSAKGFWEGRAAQLLHGALYDACLHGYQGRRDMSAVVDWFSPSKKQLEMQIQFLQGCGVRSLVRVGNQLENADEETRSNLYDTVLRHVEVWGSPAIEPIIGETTLDFAGLRRGNGTLYLSAGLFVPLMTEGLEQTIAENLGFALLVALERFRIRDKRLDIFNQFTQTCIPRSD
ncbi:type IV secretory system conjugative DNA transfer family protein [Bradyrhizobium cenepequi]